MNSMQYIQSLLDLEPGFVRDEETATANPADRGETQRYSAEARAPFNKERHGDMSGKTGHREEHHP